ncbi:MAG: hypothetical protein Q4B05_02295 [Candidatus Saccharibacteria bacterium]|nr:hypothetical protein [Candidatus Saccharibacteria bacterium]
MEQKGQDMTLRNIWRASEAHSGRRYPEGGDANKQEADTPEGETPVTLSVLQQGINQVRAVQRNANTLVEQARQEHLGPFIEAIKGVLEKLPSDEDIGRCYWGARERLERLLREKELSGKALRAYRESEYCTDALEDTPITDGLNANERKECQQAIVAATIDNAIRDQLLSILGVLTSSPPTISYDRKSTPDGKRVKEIKRPVAYVYSNTTPEHVHGPLMVEFNPQQPDSHIKVDMLDPATRHDSKQTAQDQDGIELSPLAVALCDRIRERLKELGVNGLVKVKLVSYYKGPSRGTTDILLSTELPTANSEQAPSGQPSQLGQAALRGSVHP